MKKNFKKFKSKKFNLSLVLAAGVLAVFLAINFYGSKADFGTAELSVLFPDGAKRSFSGEIIEGMTVFDAILAPVRGGNFSVDYSADGGVLEIRSVDGVAGKGTDKWQIYLNREIVDTTQIDSTGIKSGDKIELTLVNAE